MESNAVDSFALENSGTARFIGTTADQVVDGGGGGVGVGGGGGGAGEANGNASTSSNNNGSGTVNAAKEFQTIKLGNNQLASRTDIPHSELVKMLYYLEGELQARDVVIAALRNERVKQYILQLRAKRLQSNDPYAAIFRDKVALAGNLISRESSTQAAQAEMEVRQIIEQQMEQQYQMVSKQRATHLRMVNILTESLENNQRMLQELEEEKRKHEHDTAQGDDITYGLELERTKLRKELEDESAQVKKLEKDLKKLQETLEYERSRQKQIVLLLIAERKKILMKYVEEGKRSEDLAQILAEEKQRSDTIADGLEEESKKSLRMEEELERQAAAFENERKMLKVSLANQELRVKELDQEVAALREENEMLKKQLQAPSNVAQSAANIGMTGTIVKGRTFTEEACASPVVNIAKVIQPTAKITSVPVSAPTTGIARSLTPSQNTRNNVVVGVASSPAAGVALPVSTAVASSSVESGSTNVSSVVAGSITSQPSPAKMQPTATIQRAPGGKYAALAAAANASHSLDQPVPHPVPIAVPPVTVPPASARGAPPPIPPNKPIVPPKREPSLSRLGSVSGAIGTPSPTALNSNVKN